MSHASPTEGGRPQPALHIGILTDDFFPGSGGVTRSIQQQIDHLHARGHQVTLFAPRHQFVPPTHAAWETLRHWRFPGTPSFLCSLPVGPATARRLAADHPLDIVHSQNERGSIYLAGMISRLTGAAHLHTFHSNYAGTHATTPRSSGLNSLTYLPMSGRLLRLATGLGGEIRPALPTSGQATSDSSLAARDWRSLARLASAVDGFTSPAPYLIDSIKESAPELAGRGRVIASGVAEVFASARRRRGRGPVRFISCGRLGAEKRVDAVIRAFGRLGRADTELVIVGEGAEEPSLRAIARDAGPGTIRFLGHLDDPARVAAEIADSDIFVLASYHFDTQGLVLAEAASAGTPVLYCDERLTVGVGPDNALLTGPSAGELADGMLRLADDPERRAAMSSAGRRKAEGLTGAAMAEAYLDAYRGAVEVRAARTAGPQAAASS